MVNVIILIIFGSKLNFCAVLRKEHLELNIFFRSCAELQHGVYTKSLAKIEVNRSKT